jgi:hypothetical protein
MTTHPNLRSFMDLSTAHLTPATMDWLDSFLGKDNFTHWVAVTPYGWFLYADEEGDREYFPADLIACFAYARKHGAEYILFDRDADAVDDLPQYDDEESETAGMSEQDRKNLRLY